MIVFGFNDSDPMNAAILFMTDEHIDCDKTNVREQIEDILDDPSNFKMAEYTDNESMFMTIHNALSITSLDKKTLGVTVCNVWENISSLFEGYFIDIAEIENLAKSENCDGSVDCDSTKIKLNQFSSQITSQHVTGALVIVKKTLEYTINDSNIKTTPLPCTFSYNELLDVLEGIFIKNGIVIDVEGNTKSYKYIMNPIEHLILSDSNYSEKYIYHEYEVYTHVMVIFAEIGAINQKINVKASLLAGKPVHGTVHVVLYKKPEYNENPPYVSLSSQTLDIIYEIRRKSSSLTTGMEKSQNEYVNFEKLLDLENKKHANKSSLKIAEITGESLNIGNK